MAFDQAQSTRLGQKTPIESTYVLMFSGDELPEAAWPGQIIYRNDSQTLQVYDGDAWENVVGGDAGTLTFVGPTPPVSQTVGDIWFDSSDANHMYRAASVGADQIGTGEWEDMQGSPPIPGAKTYYQNTPPPVASEGDLWFETDNGNKQYYYHLATWVSVRDTTIADAQSTADTAQTQAGNAQTAANTAQSTANTANTQANNAASTAATANTTANTALTAANSKIKTYYQTAPPTGGTYIEGDLWYDTDDGYKTYRYTSGNWTNVQDAAIASAQAAATGAQSTATNAQNTANTANTNASTALTAANGKNKSYYGASQPSGGTYNDGDLWFDSSNGYKQYRYNGTTWVSVQDTSIAAAQTAANTAQTSANGKNKSYYQTTAPTGTLVEGDLWFDSANGYKAYRYTSGAWSTVQDTSIAAAQSTASSANTTANNALTTANGKNKISVGTTAPSSPVTGDQWIDTGNGNVIKVWTGSAWGNYQDTGISAAQTTANTAQTTANTANTNAGNAQTTANTANTTANNALTTANGKNKIFIQSATPTATATGDQWIDTGNGNVIKTWDGSAWVNRQDTAIAAAQSTATTANNTANSASTAAGNAQTTANTANTTAQSKNATFIQATAPTATKTGDVWIDTANGNRIMTWNGSSWINSQDTAITSAANNANTALTTANGKNTTFIQGTAPTAKATGDIWIDTSNGNLLKTWSGSAWVNSQDTAIGTAQTTANTANTNAGNAQTTANTANTTANTKTASFVQGTAPTATKTGDIWIDTANGNILKTWNGSAWVTNQDAAIATAQTAANTAQTTANGKNRVYFQTTAPTGTLVAGDLWFDTSNANKQWRYNGSAWVDALQSSMAYTQSRGTDLVTNGTGFLKNNTNFTTNGCTYDPTDAPPGINGSFWRNPISVPMSIFSDELIPIDTSKRYQFSLWLRQRSGTTGGTAYGAIAPYDGAGLAISPHMYAYTPNTLTTLAADLNPNDTTMTLTSAANWSNAASYANRLVLFWDYTDSFGHVWPANTYSRNYIYAGGTVGAYPQNGITGNVVTLSVPYAGPAKPAGTQVSNGNAGGNYLYNPVNVVVPLTWTNYAATVTGVNTTGAVSTMANGFPPGTAQVKAGFLLNYTATPSDIAAAGISLSDASAAYTLAAGKNTVQYAASAPSSANRVTGDIWYDTANGNRMYIYTTGTGWGLYQYGTASIAANAITAAQIAAQTITAAQIATDTITANQIAANAIGASELAAGSVIAGKIAAGIITSTEIATDTITAGNIAANAITASELAAGAVVAGKVAADAITANEIAAGAVNTSELAAGAVTAAAIAAGTITSSQIASGTIVAGNIATDTLTATQIAAGAITSSELATNSVIAGKVAAGTITTNEIAASTITGGNIAADTLTATQIAASAITSSELAAGAVIAGKIAAGIITATEIAGRTITAGLIATDTITANEIAANAITASELNAGAVTAGKVAANAIQAGNIAALAVTAGTIAVDAVTATEIAANAVGASEINAGAVTAGKIAANAITADKLSIGAYANKLVPNAYFEEADPVDATWSNGWTKLTGTGYTGAVYATESTTPVSGARSLKMTATAANSAGAVGRIVPCAPGDNLYIQALCRSDAASTQSVQVGLWFYDKTVTYLSTSSQLQDVTTTNAPIQYNGQAPANAAYVAPVLLTTSTSATYWDNVDMGIQANPVTIVDGAITTSKISANQIIGDHIATGTLTGDLFSGQLVMGSTISTGQLDQNGVLTGARVTLGPDGLMIYDAAGNSITSFPLDPTKNVEVKQAHIEVLSADVNDYFTMRGINNLVASSSRLTLGAGIAAPTSAPSSAFTYDTVQLDTSTIVPPQGGAGYAMSAGALDPTLIRCIAWGDPNNASVWRVTEQRSNGFRVWRFNPNGTIATKPLVGGVWVDDFAGKLIASASSNGILYHDTGWHLWTDISGNTVVATLPGSWFINANLNTQPPMLSYDATVGQHMLVQNQDGATPKSVEVRRFTVAANGTATSQSNYVSPSGIGRNSRITGAYYGTADFGAARYAITATGSAVYVCAGSTQYSGAANYAQWNTNGNPLGFGYDGANFWSVDVTGLMSKYTGWTWATEPMTTFVGMSAFDSRTAGNQANPWPGQTAGQHETPVGVLIPMTAKRRSKLTLTVPVTADTGGNDDPNQWKVYWARTTGGWPTAAQLKFVSALGSVSAPQAVTISADPTGAAPPGGVSGQSGASNNFPAGNPASLVDASSNTLIDATGFGIWAPPGTISMFGGATAPNGWLICDGRNFPNTQYPALAQVLGISYGGTLGTNFNIPDLRARFPVGFSSGAASVGNMGAFETNGNGGVSPGGAGDPARLNHQHTHGAGTNVNLLTNTTTGGTANRVSNSPATLWTDSSGVAGANSANHSFLTVQFIIKT